MALTMIEFYLSLLKFTSETTRIILRADRYQPDWILQQNDKISRERKKKEGIGRRGVLDSIEKKKHSKTFVRKKFVRELLSLDQHMNIIQSH